MTAHRQAIITGFLQAHGLGGAEHHPLAGDASARRYQRLRPAEGPPLILVDTPDPDHDLVPFVAIGRRLAGLGLSVPRVIAADARAGLALLEDFGDDTFSGRLAAGAEPEDLYALATDLLIALHQRFAVTAADRNTLPVYDADAFVAQVALFAEFYLPLATGRAPIRAELKGLEEAWAEVIGPATAGPSSLLLRDYHVDNLMVLDRPGVAAAGVLDFQDAGIGPVAYDLVSLLEDARRDVAPDLAARMIRRHLDAFPDQDPDAFASARAVLAAVRHARIIAVFVRLAVTQGKRAYLAHLPRVWRLLEARLAEPALAPVADRLARLLPIEARHSFIVPETEL